MPLTTCGPSNVISGNDTCDPGGPFNRISLTQEAVRNANFERSAESTITLSQRAPGFWSLTASNSLALTQDLDNLRVVFGDAQNLISLLLNQVTTVSGGQSQHVNVINPLDVVYISGDENTDDGIRLRLDPTDGITHVERRTLGVWNPTPLEVTGQSGDHEPIFTFPTGFNRLLFDVSSGMIINNSGNPIANGDAGILP